VLQFLVGRAPGPASTVGLPLERQDLGGIKFVGQNLDGVSLRGCDLTDTVFQATSLANVDFSDALLKNTAFIELEKSALLGANFGDLSRFYSVRADRTGGISSHTDMRRWLEKRTRLPSSPIEPCASALQLRFIFGKFVRPDGSARRDEVDLKGVLAGKRYESADAEGIVDAALRYGYLNQRAHGRIARPREQYSEVVQFVTSLRVSPGLRAMLSDVCEIPNCVHMAA
jgi:hypothetical protein